MMKKQIGIMGKPGVGKTAFINAIKNIPYQRRPYNRTIGHEAHLIGIDDTTVILWEFGHFWDSHGYSEKARDMDGFIYITRSDKKYHYQPEKPFVVFKNNGMDPFDARSVVRTLLNQL